MIGIEKLNFRVDIGILRDSLSKIKDIGPMVFQGSEFGYKSFGGWNVQSRSGDYKDGFQVGIEKCYRKDGTFDYRLAKFLQYSHAFEHKNKTQVCLRHISEIIDYLEEKGFYPRRARVTCLKAHSKSIIHRDAPSNIYMARIHIPIITNPKCIHWMSINGNKRSYHMPADGSVYILPVNCLHQIINDSDEDRYHIIMDAYDTKSLTENFKYDGDINKLIEESKEYRKKIDETKLPLHWKIFYTIGMKFVLFKFKLEQKMIETSYKLNEQ